MENTFFIAEMTEFTILLYLNNEISRPRLFRQNFNCSVTQLEVRARGISWLLLKNKSLKSASNFYSFTENHEKNFYIKLKLNIGQTQFYNTSDVNPAVELFLRKRILQKIFQLLSHCDVTCKESRKGVSRLIYLLSQKRTRS